MASQLFQGVIEGDWVLHRSRSGPKAYSWFTVGGIWCGVSLRPWGTWNGLTEGATSLANLLKHQYYQLASLMVE